MIYRQKNARLLRRTKIRTLLAVTRLTFLAISNQNKDGSKHSTEHTNVLTPEENSSTGLSYEVSSFSKSPALAELHFPDIDVATTSILREHDSESEDELEQFVFQPKSRREENCNFLST